MFQEIEAPKSPWFVRYFIHWLLAVPVSLIIGEAPDQYLYERLQVEVGLGAAIVGAVLGYLFNRKRLDRVACLVFLPALIFFADVVYQNASRWTPERTTSSRLQFVIDNAFGLKPRCQGDCFDAIAFMMLMPSLAYSAGAYVAVRRAWRRSSDRCFVSEP